MCGIVGYLGPKPVVPILVNGLRYLEYRGYDSAGIAYLNGEEDVLQVYKSAGKLLNLEKLLPTGLLSQTPTEQRALTTSSVSGQLALDGSKGSSTVSSPHTLNPFIGIGHIRWATHGVPNDVNAHPHLSQHKEVALVHNGIIENYNEIKQDLTQKGMVFQTETDTECVVQLMEYLMSTRQCPEKTSFMDILKEATQILKGAYALTIICKKEPTKLYAVRNHAPLVIGVGENEFFVASDAIAIVDHTNRIIYLKDNEIVCMTKAGSQYSIDMQSNEGTVITPHIETVTLSPLQLDKKGFKHYMLKEIHEQPDVVRNSLSGRLLGPQDPIRLLSREAEETQTQETLKSILTQAKRLVVIGCGTSFNAGMVGKYFIEEVVKIPVEVESAGEYRYRNPVITEDTVIIAMSQSGETADTIEAVRQSALQGAKVITLTNREDSTLARESDLVLPVRAGVEVSVCATKTFTAQVIVLYLLGMAMAENRQAVGKGTVNLEFFQELKKGLQSIPALIEAILSNPTDLQATAKRFGNARDILFIARGVNFPVALEGALKLKEISYIHAEGYSGSELKHGPIAMLDEAVPVVSILTPGHVFDKIFSNCQEARARDARMIAVTNAELTKQQADLFESILRIPDTGCSQAVGEWLSPLLTTVPLQLLAYYMAEYLGKDVDQPRNLAKSVTVE